MPRNVKSKYKIDRRRSRREVEPPTEELVDSESESSDPNENDEEYKTQDDEDIENEEDEVQYEAQKRRVMQRRSHNLNDTSESSAEKEKDTEEMGDGESSEDSDDYVPRNRRSRLIVKRVTDSGDEESDFGTENITKQTTRRSARLYPRNRPAIAQAAPDKTSGLFDDSDDDDLEEEVMKEGEKNQKSRKNMKSSTCNTPFATTGRRSNRLSSKMRRRLQSSKGGGDVLANLPSPPSTSGDRNSAVKARRKLVKIAEEESKRSHGEEDGDGNNDRRSGSGSEEDSCYDEEEELAIDEMLEKRTRSKDLGNSNQFKTKGRKRRKAAHSSDEEFVLDSDDDGDEEKEQQIDETLEKRTRGKHLGSGNRSKTKGRKRKKVPHSSDEEFVLDSDDDGDDSSLDQSLNDDDSAELVEDENDISVVGDPDLSDDDSDQSNAIQNEIEKKDATNVVNVDNENFCTIDDDEEDVPSFDNQSKKDTPLTDKKEILPSPRGIENAFESDVESSGEGNGGGIFKISTRQVKCPKCPSTEDAITFEKLPMLHVCYIAPDGKSRQCFNLETLRQIALKSSQLKLRVDIDGERQNFLQPPAFRTAMSDDMVDQIASKFGRGALDLHGAYYKNRSLKYENKDDESSYDSSGSGNENIYLRFDAFHERVRNYFKNGMGSQDLYVCPLCYRESHRIYAHPSSSDNDEDNEDAEKYYDALPSDSIYDPMTVLGHLDNDGMTIASQFCFKKLADVKKHLRQEHNVDTGGIQGNELYKRYRVRAPDGLLQRWLPTQVRGHVKQGHMRMYWFGGNDQIYIDLLDLIERVKAYAEDSPQLGDDSSEEDGADDEMNENVNKAREFFDTFAEKASEIWKIISSPFLKSNENIDDFIAKDDDIIEEKGIEEPHAILHQQYMNAMNEDSDENDLVHKLKRKYAETSDEETASNDSSTEEELEFVNDKESDVEDDEQEDVYNRNGYYSPIEEEKDEWVLKIQSQRKRRTSSLKKRESTDSKVKTPIGKRLFQRKTMSTGTSSSPSGAHKKTRKLTIEDSSDDESF